MAPINLPDGSQVSEIVLPDGSTASEVLAPDGSTVFSTIPDSVIDNGEEFSDGPYESGDSLTTFYSGATSTFDRLNNSTQQGDYLYEAPVTADPEIIVSTSGDGLPDYPEQGGDIFSAVLEDTDGNGGPGLVFGAADSDNNYAAAIRGDINKAQITKLSGGGLSVLSDTSVTINANQPYDVEVDWNNDDTITVNVYEFNTLDLTRGTQVVSGLSATDSEHAGRVGMGWLTAGDAGAASNPVRMDYYRFPNR